MERNNHPQGTRNSRRNKKKHVFSKKLAFVSILTVSFILIGGGVYATYAMQHKPKEANELEDNSYFEQKDAALLAKIRESQKNEALESTEQEKTNGNIQSLTYEPAASDSIPQLVAIKTELTALMTAAEKTAQKNCHQACRSHKKCLKSLTSDWLSTSC